MARTLIAQKEIVGNVASYVDMIAGATGADDANEMMFINPGGRTLLFVIATATGAVDVSIVGIADPYGRTETLGPTSIGNGEIQIMGPFAPLLFTQPSGADQFRTYVDIANVTASPVLQALQL